jgi:hypothetical protein
MRERAFSLQNMFGPLCKTVMSVGYKEKLIETPRGRKLGPVISIGRWKINLKLVETNKAMSLIRN